MASVSLFVFLVLSQLVLLLSAEEEGKLGRPSCWPFQYCENLGHIYFPFTKIPPPFCGLLQVECDRDKKPPTIRLPMVVQRSERPYEVININYTTQQIHVRDHSLLEDRETNNCNYLDKFALPNSPSISFKLNTPNQTLFKCSHTPEFTSHSNFKSRKCRDYDFYFGPPSFTSNCSNIQLPVNESSDKDKLNLSAEFVLEWHVSDDCSRCDGKGGLCSLDFYGKFYCDLYRKGIDIGITQKCFDAHTHVHS